MGGTLVITGRNEQRLQETLNSLTGAGHELIVCDLTDESSTKKLAEAVPKLDGIVHCAGIVTALPVKYINRENIEGTFGINYISCITLMTNLFSKRQINRNASIVFISSFAGTFPLSGGALYAGSKAALEKYSDVLASEHAVSGIRSNCVSPALINTNILADAFSGDRAKYRKEVEAKYLLGFGEPEDVANLVVFLLSHASKWITGQNIILDGGYLRGLISKMTRDY